MNFQRAFVGLFYELKYFFNARMRNSLRAYLFSLTSSVFFVGIDIKVQYGSLAMTRVKIRVI